MERLRADAYCGAHQPKTASRFGPPAPPPARIGPSGESTIAEENVLTWGSALTLVITQVAGSTLRISSQWTAVILPGRVTKRSDD